MARRSGRKAATRRTTLTLPAASLAQAERIARSRHVNLSTVVAEALADGLQAQASAARSQAVVDSYARAFAGFSEEELAIINGIDLEPRPVR